MWTISPTATNMHAEYTHFNSSINTYTILSNDNNIPYKFKFDEASGNYLWNYDPSISSSNTRRIGGVSGIANNTLHKKIKPCTMYPPTTPHQSSAVYYMEVTEHVDNSSSNISPPPELVQIMSIRSEQPGTSLDTSDLGNSDTTRKKDLVTCLKPNILQGSCHIPSSSTVNKQYSNQTLFNQSNMIIQSSQIGGANNNAFQIGGADKLGGEDNNVHVTNNNNNNVYVTDNNVNNNNVNNNNVNNGNKLVSEDNNVNANNSNVNNNNVNSNNVDNNVENNNANNTNVNNNRAFFHFFNHTFCYIKSWARVKRLPCTN